MENFNGKKFNKFKNSKYRFFSVNLESILISEKSKSVKMADVDHELSAIRFVVVSHLLKSVEEED